MAKVVMEFEKGGSFEVVFNPDAPKTADAFRQALPVEGICLQGRYAGEEFFFNAPVETAPENLVEASFGDVAFNSDPNWKAVCVYYGPKHRGGPYSLFARLEGDLGELNGIGLRIWKEGGEKVTVRELEMA